jgi:hypothetical protein
MLLGVLNQVRPVRKNDVAGDVAAPLGAHAANTVDIVTPVLVPQLMLKPAVPADGIGAMAPEWTMVLSIAAEKSCVVPCPKSA